MTARSDEVLATIDAAVDGRCACGCGAPLDPAGPSAWFASEACQRRWSGRQVGVPDAAVVDDPALPNLDQLWSLHMDDMAELRARLALAFRVPPLPPLFPPRVEAEVWRARFGERWWPCWRWELTVAGRVVASGRAWTCRRADRAAYDAERGWRARQPSPLLPINVC